MKKKLVIGFLAHVDAGKTTLSEAVLYSTGVTRKLGRVDHKDTFLDTDKEEKERGITIYSKAARFCVGETDFTLLDTPGHRDYQDEMEKALKVLDYAVVIISAADGIQMQTEKILDLLEEYRIPVFFFINKMDRNDVDRDSAFEKVRNYSKALVIMDSDSLNENLADASDELAEEYLEKGEISEESIRYAIRDRKLMPVYFGSALKNQGIDEMMKDLDRLTLSPGYGDRLSYEVFKVDRDSKGNEQIHIKITGGSVKVKELLGNEKVNEIRAYSGKNFDQLTAASAGDLVTLTGVKSIIDDEKSREKAKASLSGWDRTIDCGSGEENILLEFVDEEESEEERQAAFERWRHGSDEDKKIEKDLNAIFKKTYGESKRDEQAAKERQAKSTHRKSSEIDNFPMPNWREDRGKGQPYLIIDGYNVIFQWEELSELAKINLDSAREMLIEILQNYQGYKKVGITAVFDAYKVPGNTGSKHEYGNVKVIFTKEQETADRYIERLMFEEGKKYDFTVVTSDQAVQMASMGDGARRLSSREFYAEVCQTSEEIRQKLKSQKQLRNRPFEGKI